jgi:hypothetical protein
LLDTIGASEADIAVGILELIAIINVTYASKNYTKSIFFLYMPIRMQKYPFY